MAITELAVQRTLQKLKMLDKNNLSVQDVVYNLDCIIDFFETIKHLGASHTVRCAKDILISDVSLPEEILKLSQEDWTPSDDVEERQLFTFWKVKK